jgi:hypothetical protein
MKPNLLLKQNLNKCTPHYCTKKTSPASTLGCCVFNSGTPATSFYNRWTENYSCVSWMKASHYWTLPEKTILLESTIVPVNCNFGAHSGKIPCKLTFSKTDLNLRVVGELMQVPLEVQLCSVNVLLQIGSRPNWFENLNVTEAIDVIFAKI